MQADRVLADERLRDLEQEVARAEADALESAEQQRSAQLALEARQTGRGGTESRLQDARDRLTGLHASRAEAQARLDALAAQLEYHAAKIATATESVRSAGEATAVADDGLRRATAEREHSERKVQELTAKVDAAKKALLSREAESREAQSKRDSVATNQSKLSAQLEVLEQAEQTLSGYADGARFLLDPSRQSRLQIKGSFSGMLEVPAELETAIAAALGDAVDTVLLETDSIDRALEMLDAEDAGRAVMLPLESRVSPSLVELSDGDLMGVGVAPG